MNNKQKVLFVVLAIVGVLLTLQINGALAQEQPKKCTIPHETPGAFEVPGMGYGAVLYYHSNLKPQNITVLGTKDVPCVDEKGKETTCKMYRFDGDYDQIQIYCGGCDKGHPLKEFPIPPIAHKNMLVEIDQVTCK